MTDKQKIIDGVDVSGCRFYSEKLSTMNGTGSISVTMCNGFCTHNIRGLDDSSCYDAHTEYAKCKNNNCYYKQLKAENEELKRQLEATKGLVTVGNRQLAEALKGYEELKKCYKNNSALLDFEETNTTKLVNKVMKLEKTLAEIKEIAEEKAKVNDWLALDILQQINECEMNDERI